MVQADTKQTDHQCGMGQLLAQAPQPWGGRTPRPWQAAALPVAMDALEVGRSGIIRAATGSGKSVLQAELIAQRVARLEDDARVVVSVPTQSLVRQLAATIEHRVGMGLVGRYYQHAKELHAPVIVTCHASMADGEASHACPSCDALDAVMTQRVKTHPPAADPCARCGGDQWLRAPGGLAQHMTREGLRVALWVADECHKTECPQIHHWFDWAQPSRQIGFTATPWRAEERERLQLWQDILYDYGPVDAIRDGVIMPPQIVGWDGEATDGDAVCVEMIKAQLARSCGPGVVSAEDVADAQRFAAMLTREGIPAAAISYRDGRDGRALLLERLRTGELRALVYCSLLAEGVDLPWLEWLCMRRLVRSRVRLPQEVGRVVRVHEGKAGAWVLDPFDLFGTLALDYDAVLGWDDDEPELDPLVAAAVDALEQIDGGGQRGGSAPWRMIRKPCVRWLRECVMAARLHGWSSLRVKSTSWRHKGMTHKQARAIGSAMGLPQIRRAAVELHDAPRRMFRNICVAARAEELDRGTAADLIELLEVLACYGRLPGGAS